MATSRSSRARTTLASGSCRTCCPMRRSPICCTIPAPGPPPNPSPGPPALEGLKLSKLHPFEITTTDGMKFVSYYLLPPASDPDGDGKPSSPLPTVVPGHGGHRDA